MLNMFQAIIWTIADQAEQVDSGDKPSAEPILTKITNGVTMPQWVTLDHNPWVKHESKKIFNISLDDLYTK